MQIKLQELVKVGQKEAEEVSERVITQWSDAQSAIRASTMAFAVPNFKMASVLNLVWTLLRRIRKAADCVCAMISISRQ